VDGVNTWNNVHIGWGMIPEALGVTAERGNKVSLIGHHNGQHGAFTTPKHPNPEALLGHLYEALS
jgi:hypothetical protein